MVIVADSSAWIELLRGSGHPVATTLRSLIERRAEIAITETVLMEVLAGRRSGEHTEEARRRLVAFPILRLEGTEDFEEAARIYRACREAGHTLRSQLDLLVAVPTISHDGSLLHNDHDFEVIAQHSALRLHPLDAADGGREVRESRGKWRARGRSRSRTARRPRSPLRA